MATSHGGFDNTFVKKLDERFTCPICHLALKEPQLTKCGHHFCESCLNKCLQRDHSCPVCRKELEASKIFPNNALKREILALKIKCTRVKEGCEWVGELRKTEDHDKDCEYVDEDCANRCGERVIRKVMENHKEQQCPRRKTGCKHCHSTLEWKDLQDHYNKCPKYPVNCTYNCGETVARHEMADHVGHQGTCPNSLLDCNFKNIGCLFKGNRKELLVHIKDDADNHFTLMANKVVATERELEMTKRKLAIMESQMSFSVPVNPPDPFVHTWKIENWSQRMLEAKAGVDRHIESNPFYVPPGYHLHLRAYPNEVIDDISYLGIYLFATTGSFDDSIRWPFPFSFNLDLVDQQSDGKNISCKSSPPFENALKDPATDVVGHGIQDMASHEALETHCYIKDDAIIINLTVHLKNYP